MGHLINKARKAAGIKTKKEKAAEREEESIRSRCPRAKYDTVICHVCHFLSLWQEKSMRLSRMLLVILLGFHEDVELGVLLYPTSTFPLR